MDFPWLSVIGAVPLVAAAGVAASPRSLAGRIRGFALGATLLTLVLTLLLALQFDVGAGERFQFAETYAWIPQLGVSYALGVDGIALVMVALTVVLVPVVVLAAWNEVEEDRSRSFYGLVLVLETMMIGVFVARDVFLFYVLFEAMLLPVYFLIGVFGGAQRRYAAAKFLILSLIHI